MAALAIASSLLARLLAAAPVKLSLSKDADPAHALPPLDGLFPKLFEQVVKEEADPQTARASLGREETGEAASPHIDVPAVLRELSRGPSGGQGMEIRLPGASRGVRVPGSPCAVDDEVERTVSENLPALPQAVLPSPMLVVPVPLGSDVRAAGMEPGARVTLPLERLPATGSAAPIAPVLDIPAPPEPVEAETKARATRAIVQSAPPAEVKATEKPEPTDAMPASQIPHGARIPAFLVKSAGTPSLPQTPAAGRSSDPAGQSASTTASVDRTLNASPALRIAPAPRKRPADPAVDTLMVAAAPSPLLAAAPPREIVPARKAPSAREHEIPQSPDPAAVVKAMTWPAPIPDRVNPAPVPIPDPVELANPVDAPDAKPQLKLVAPGVPEPAEVAFIAQLTPFVAPEDPPAQTEHLVERLVLENTSALPAGNNVPLAATPVRAHVDPPATASQEPVPTATARPRRQDPSTQAPQEQPAVAPNRMILYPQSTAQPHAETTAVAERTADPPEQAARTQPEAPPEPPKVPALAREIRLALPGGEQRVEVKLTDRGGEVQVAVRTADGPLAERLRENLPALTSRLAENGIRAETWHPPASGGSDWRQGREASPANSGDPSDPQPRQDGRQQGRDSEPRHPRVVEENDQPREKGKDFTWLMSTLR